MLPSIRHRSKAQAEGQITKLKLVQRQMYGRGKLGLLQSRVIDLLARNLHQICIRAKLPRRMTLASHESDTSRTETPTSFKRSP